MIPSKLGASDAILGSKCRVEWGGGTIEVWVTTGTPIIADSFLTPRLFLFLWVEWKRKDWWWPGFSQLSGKPTKRRRSQLIMACILMPNRVAIATLSSPSWLLKPTYCKHAILLRMKKEKVLFFPPWFDLLSSFFFFLVSIWIVVERIPPK